MPDANISKVLTDFIAQCPPEIIDKGVAYLKSLISEKDKADIRKMAADDPAEWWALYHHGWGTAIRNKLRHHVCLDKELPSGNWDDYYIQMVEIACGVRAR